MYIILLLIINAGGFYPKTCIPQHDADIGENSLSFVLDNRVSYSFASSN